jgi:hypothetical protein
MKKTAIPRVVEVSRAIKRALAGEIVTWEAARDVSRYHVWSADQFIDDPNEPLVYQLRAIPRDYFEEARKSSPESLRLTQSPARHLSVVP